MIRHLGTGILVLFLTSVILALYTHYTWNQDTFHGHQDLDDSRLFQSQDGSEPSSPRKAIIVASMKFENTSWVSEFLEDWEKNIYVMDDARAKLTVAKNKGRESTAYLTYIIDNYEHLPDYMVFLHSSRYQWHNEDPMYDGVAMVQRLRLEHLDDVGYANLRCSWVIGCPAEMGNLDGSDGQQAETEAVFLAAFKELYPGLPEPSQVGVPCCAQFGVAKTQVLQRPKEDYLHYLHWLRDTPLDDGRAGRVLEYSWHIMMGKSAVYCPTAQDCFCQTYGLCGLTCFDDGNCGRFTLPPSATLPQGWPHSGMEGKDGWPAEGWAQE